VACTGRRNPSWAQGSGVQIAPPRPFALTDATGVIRTSYSYYSFGQTTGCGTASTNSFQFGGRENDGSGLYYLRARYYHPVVQRFIGQDPIGFRGGINQYSYATNDPVDLSDPSRTNPLVLALLAPLSLPAAPAIAIGAVVIGGIYLLTPQGRLFVQQLANTFSKTKPKEKPEEVDDPRDEVKQRPSQTYLKFPDQPHSAMRRMG
jgi:RHS repeat-associated protein